MDEPKITSTLMSEDRTDDAVRHIAVSGLPDLTYTARAYRSGELIRTWRADRGVIRWDHGVPWTFGLLGFRVKKDGTPSKIGETCHWGVRDGKVREHHRYPGYEAHVQRLLDEWATVPPFSGPRAYRVAG